MADARGSRSPTPRATPRTARSSPYTRELIAQRRELGDGYRTLPSAGGVWAYARGDATCVLNMTGDTAEHDGAILEPWQGLILPPS